MGAASMSRFVARVSSARRASGSRKPRDRSLGRRSRGWPVSRGAHLRRRESCGPRRARGRTPARHGARCALCTSLAGWLPSPSLRAPSGGRDPVRGTRARGSDRRQGHEGARSPSRAKTSRRTLSGHTEIPAATPSLQAWMRPAPPCSARRSRSPRRSRSRSRAPTRPDCRSLRPRAHARVRSPVRARPGLALPRQTGCMRSSPRQACASCFRDEVSCRAAPSLAGRAAARATCRGWSPDRRSDCDGASGP